MSNRGWESPLPAGGPEASGSPESQTTACPHLSLSYPIPYPKDFVSHRLCVQAAVEVLNPLVQFLFPSSDTAQQVFCGHHLVEACRKKALRSSLWRANRFHWNCRTGPGLLRMSHGCRRMPKEREILGWLSLVAALGLGILH